MAVPLRQPLLLAGVIVLAGCSGLAPSAPTATETPASPTATSTAAYGSYPTGLGATGITDPSGVVDAHRGALSDGYTVTELAVVRHDDGAVRSRESSTVRVGPDPSRYRYETNASGSAASFAGANATENVTLERYANGSAVLQRLAATGTVSYGLVTDRQGDPSAPGTVHHGTPRNAGRLLALLGTAENVTVTRTEDGTYRLRATGVSQSEIVVAGLPVENISRAQFTATISADGLVRAYQLEVEGTVDCEPVSGTERVSYEAVETTSVQRPSWYQKAAGNRTT